jgi:replicative superfamily II helicase
VQAHSLTAEHLMALTQGLPELDNVFVPIMKTNSKAGRKIVQSETRWPRDAVQRYGQTVVASLQRNASDFFDYYARCKRATLLWDWVRGVPMERIEQNYSVNAYNAVGYGHVRSCADATRFHLRAASQIATVMFIDQGPTEESIETLLKQLEVGIPADALDLISIPVPLTRGEYLALYQVGIQKAEDLWAHSSSSINEILGADRAAQLEKFRPSSRSSAATG